MKSYEQISTEFMEKVIARIETARDNYYQIALTAKDENLALSHLKLRSNLATAIDIVRETWEAEYGDDNRV